MATAAAAPTTTTAPAGVPPPEWTVVYHGAGAFKGRGEFLRIMLEDAGQRYVNSEDAIHGPQGMMDLFRGSIQAVAEDEAEPLFPCALLFPPAIWHRPSGKEEVLINQVGACMIYLGDSLGYTPLTSAERARANCILLNTQDYIGEGRISFHPVENKLSYHKQKEQGDIASKAFSQDRMKRFLHHFNKVVLKYGPLQPVAGGPKITYADFALFHVLDATVHQFNTEFYEYAWDNTNVQALKEFYHHFKARPNLAAYFKSDRCPPYAGDSMM